MGKDSLIKSTSKKKAKAKPNSKKTTKKAAAKSTPVKKTTDKKPAAKAAKKSAPKKTTAKKTAPKAAAPKATKSAAAAGSKPATKKEATPMPVKKLSIKELVFKKFEPLQPDAPVVAAPSPPAMPAAAPPLIASSDKGEVKRLRALLLQQFSMDAVKAAAKAPQPAAQPVAAAEPETEPAVQPAAASEPKAEPAATKPAEVKPAEDSAYITIEPSEDKPATDPVTRAAKIAAAVFAAIVFLLLVISYNNSSKFYIYPKDNAIEIWKGRFSPKDKMFYMVLHGVELAEPPAAVYTENEVFPLIFNYYLDKADTLLEVPGLPDFEGIKNYLNKAKAYVVNSDMKAAVTTRLNTIERMILLYKADVAMSKGTIESLQLGIKLLKEADVITASDIQSQEILQKIEAAREQIEELKASLNQP